MERPTNRTSRKKVKMTLTRHVVLSILLWCTCHVAAATAESPDGAQLDVTAGEEVTQRYRDGLLQMEMVEPVLVAPGGQALPCPEAPDLRDLGREHDGQLYVFAVNIGENPQMLRLEVPGKWGGVSVKGERRAVRLHDGQLSDTLAPFASHVYELVKH